MMGNEEVLREIRNMSREFRNMSRVLLLANAKVIEAELAKIATTTERKKMWVLMDGTRKPKDIATAVKVTPMAVSYFLSAGVSAKLVDYHPGDAPLRAVDYVPPAWLELTKLPESEVQASASAGQFTIDTQGSQPSPEVQQ
ncbi:MAG: hypothetical protein JRN68_06575 [Nitrososphaerota archaeon]|nr:hypothetical protein [Nitrososphaerota archaeon]